MPDLLTLREVAKILGVHESRIYQLDEELKPVQQKRGTKTLKRYYDPATVEAYRLERAQSRGTEPLGACSFCGGEAVTYRDEIASCAVCRKMRGSLDPLEFLEHVLKIADLQTQQ